MKKKYFISASDAKKGKLIEIRIKHKRERNGCDFCNYNKTYKTKDPPTEMFIGLCGNFLWCCDDCFERITQSGQEMKEDRKT